MFAGDETSGQLARPPRATAAFWELPPAGVTQAKRASAQWPGLRAEYAWLPPFEGETITQPNRIEVVFSAHHGVIQSQGGQQYQLEVHPGAMFIVGNPSTSLMRVREPSDTLEMFVADEYLAAAAESFGLMRAAYIPTLASVTSLALPHDPVALAAAHLLRRACIGTIELADIEASAIAGRLADTVLRAQGHPRAGAGPRGLSLDHATLTRVVDYVEARLTENVTVLDLSDVAGLSLFHFTRAFGATMGMPPHQYVISRRLDRAKHLLMTTNLIVQHVAWSLGFENLSHFRRKFHAQFGITPARLRDI